MTLEPPQGEHAGVGEATSGFARVAVNVLSSLADRSLSSTFLQPFAIFSSPLGEGVHTWGMTLGPD